MGHWPENQDKQLSSGWVYCFPVSVFTVCTCILWKCRSKCIHFIFWIGYSLNPLTHSVYTPTDVSHSICLANWKFCVRSTEPMSSTDMKIIKFMLQAYSHNSAVTVLEHWSACSVKKHWLIYICFQRIIPQIMSQFQELSRYFWIFVFMSFFYITNIIIKKKKKQTQTASCRAWCCKIHR